MPQAVEPVTYFAYGPELRSGYMSELCPDAVPLEPARVPNHTLSFTGRSREWGGGTATIALAPGRDLWGGLYRIDQGCRAELEAWGREQGCVWCWTQVLTSKGERTATGLLVKVRDMEPSTPNPDYLARLQEAWREWGVEGMPGAGRDPGGGT